MNCGEPIHPGDSFCGNCGTAIVNDTASSQEHRCPACGYTAEEHFKFCPECGYQMASSPSASTSHNPVEATERDSKHSLAQAARKEASQQASTKKQAPARKASRKSKTKKRLAPPSKKEGGCLRTLGRILLWSILFLAAALAFLYFLGDDPDSRSAGEYNRSTASNSPVIDQPEEADIRKGRTLRRGTIYPHNAQLASEDGKVSMSFDPLCFDQPVQGEIIQVDVKNPPANTIINAYEFNVAASSELAGIATLTIPYDPLAIPPGRSAAECVSGVYYHEELHEWIEEAASIDEDRHVILIKTPHLSDHGSKISLTEAQEDLSDLMLVRALVGRPDERALPLDIENLVKRLSQEDMDKILRTLSTFGAGNPRQMLSDASLKFLGDGGTYVGMGNDLFQLAPYNRELVNNLSKKLTKFGTALIIVQFASDVYYDKPIGVVAFNAAKGVFFLKFAATMSSGGPVAAGVATVMVAAMFILDVSGIAPISPPLYMDEVYHRTAVRAYDMYYEERGYSEKKWIELIQDLMNDVAEEGLSAEAYNKRYVKLLKDLVTDYTELFFNEDQAVITKYMERAFDEVQGYLGKNTFFGYDRVYSETDTERNKKYVKAYVDEILEGQYNGETTSLVDEIRNKYKEELLKKTIPSVMKRKSEQERLRQQDLLRTSQAELIQMLNSTFHIHFVDRNVGLGEKSKYDSYLVAPIVKHRNTLPDYKPAEWIVRLNSLGEGQLDMTILAHYRTKYFTEFGLYKADAYQGIIDGTAKPVKRLKVGEISSKDHYINISGDDAKILIKGARYTDVEVPIGSPLEYSFTAESDYNKKCSIVWDFGDSQKVQKVGNRSTVTHTFSEPGKYQISAALYDDSDTKLATDIVTINIQEGKAKAGELSEDLAFYQLYFEDKPTEMVYAFAKGYVVMGRWNRVRDYLEDGSVLGGLVDGDLAMGKYRFDKAKQVYYGDLGSHGRFSARVSGNRIKIYNEKGEFFRDAVLLTEDQPFVKKKPKQYDNSDWQSSGVFPEVDE